jgi:hypothetical protein
MSRFRATDAPEEAGLDWPLRQREGFALAAAAHADAGAAAAVDGLAPQVRAHASELCRSLGQMERSARHAFLRTLLAPPVLPAVDETRWPARALGLLAASVDRSRGRRWLETCPPPRLGFAARPDLIALLGRLAAR